MTNVPKPATARITRMIRPSVRNVRLLFIFTEVISPGESPNLKRRYQTALRNFATKSRYEKAPRLSSYAAMQPSSLFDLAPAAQGLGDGHAIGVFQVATYRQAARQTGHPNAQRLNQPLK